MIARHAQRFALLFLATAAIAAGRDLQPGNVAALTFRDVDGDELATAAGHVTIITVVTRENETQAQAVADQVPDRYIGDPKFRYVTLVNFQRKLVGPLRGLTRTIIRNRLDGEAKKIKPQYDAKHLTRDPRRDIFVIADFDGAAVTSLGLSPESSNISVFVFNGRGKLIQRWSTIPPGDSLAKTIAAAEH